LVEEYGLFLVIAKIWHSQEREHIYGNGYVNRASKLWVSGSLNGMYETGNDIV